MSCERIWRRRLSEDQQVNEDPLWHGLMIPQSRRLDSRSTDIIDRDKTEEEFTGRRNYLWWCGGDQSSDGGRLKTRSATIRRELLFVKHTLLQNILVHEQYEGKQLP